MSSAAPPQDAFPGQSIALPPPGQERWHHLDALRGLAITAVVLIHLAARVPAGHAWAVAAQPIDHFCRFGVPLFLAAHTAMVARQALAGPPSWRTLLERLRLVAVPYLVWSLLYGALGPVDGQWQPPADAAGWLTEIALGYTAEQLWFMPAYLGALALVVPGAALVRAAGRAGPPWLSLAAVVGVALTAQVAGQAWLVTVSQVDRAPPALAGWLLRAEGRSPLHWIGFLAVGWWIGLHWTRGWRPPAWSRWLALPALAFHGWLALRPSQASRFDDFWCSPAMTGVFVLFLLWGWPLVVRLESIKAPWMQWFCAVLVRLGRDSLPVYLAHVAWLRLAWWALGDRWPLPASLAAATVATVVGSLLYFPVHAALFGRRRPLPVRA